MSVLYIFIEIWLVEVTCLIAYAWTCARINGLKRFNQLSLSRNSFFYLYSVSFNLFVEYLTFIQITSREVADEDVLEWTVDQFDYHFHAFLRIFLPKMEFSLKFYEKMRNGSEETATKIKISMILNNFKSCDFIIWSVYCKNIHFSKISWSRGSGHMITKFTSIGTLRIKCVGSYVIFVTSYDIFFNFFEFDGSLWCTRFLWWRNDF